jgi:fatty-acyl-CoA synthase
VTATSAPQQFPGAPSYASGVSGTPLLGDTIGYNLRQTVARVPEHEALVDVPTGRRWTYATFARDVDALASGLQAAGVTQGDRVGMWAPNCPEWTLLQYASATIGAILVNINPAYRTHELEFVLQQAAVSLLVAAPAFKGSDYGAMIEEVRPRCDDLAQVVLLGSGEWDGLATTEVDQDLLTESASRLSADQPTSRSTFSTRQAPPASRRAPPSATTTSSTTYSSSVSSAATPNVTACAYRCPSTTASG